MVGWVARCSYSSLKTDLVDVHILTVSRSFFHDEFQPAGMPWHAQEIVRFAIFQRSWTRTMQTFPSEIHWLVDQIELTLCTQLARLSWILKCPPCTLIFHRFCDIEHLVGCWPKQHVLCRMARGRWPARTTTTRCSSCGCQSWWGRSACRSPCT